MSQLFFDVFASLIRSSISFPEHNQNILLDIADEEKIVGQATSIFQQIFGPNKYSYDNLPINPQKSKDIIKECFEKKDYFFNKYLLSYLDSLIDIDKLKRDITSRYIIEYGNNPPIEGLNSNIKETKIIILPKFRTPFQATHKQKQVIESESSAEHSKKENKRWNDEINNMLLNLFFVDVEKLNGFNIVNIFFEQDFSDKSFFTVGFTPITNVPFQRLFSYDSIVRKHKNGHRIKYLSNITLLNKEQIEERFLACYELACKNKIDLLFAPELLGTDSLTNVDKYGRNPLLKGKKEYSYFTPLVTLTPTYWNNCTNSLSIYTKNGKRVSIQYKQNSYVHAGKTEDLSNTKKEIVVAHINGWGRLVFPICADLLNENYRNILVTELNATMVICPSFSPGTREFEKISSLCSAHDFYCIWGNSCAATSSNPEPPEYPAIVSLPIISSAPERTRLHTKCDQNCEKPCLFRIKIPLQLKGDSLHEDKNAEYDHIFSE